MAELSTPASNAITFDAAGYSRLPAEIALRLIGRAMTQIGDEGPVELGKLEALKAALGTVLKGSKKAANERFRRSLAGAVVTLAPPKITVERAPPRQQTRRQKSLTTRRRDHAGRPKTR